MVKIIKEDLDIEEFNQVYSLDSTLKQKKHNYVNITYT